MVCGEIHELANISAESMIETRSPYYWDQETARDSIPVFLSVFRKLSVDRLRN